MDQKTFERGREIRSSVLGKEFVDNAFKTADDFNRPLQELVTEYCWGAIWGREELPRTPYLDHTLRRARTAAEQRSHRYVTLEHLLLALLDDPDAAKLLQVTGTDVAAIRSIAADAVNNRMASLVGPGGRQPSFSYRFDSLFQCANENAKGLRFWRARN